jgi:hypothetical protein
MNKRIRELYNQSLEEKYQYGGSDAKPGEMYSNYITVLNPEKFAELIVRRTLEIVEAHTEIFQSDQARVMVEHIKHSVKTDFGVES